MFGMGYFLAHMLKDFKVHAREYGFIYFIFGIPVLITLLLSAEAVYLRSSDTVAGLFLFGFLVRFFKTGLARELLDNIIYKIPSMIRESREEKKASKKRQEDESNRQAYEKNRQQKSDEEYERQKRQRDEEAKRRAEQFKQEREAEKERKEQSKQGQSGDSRSFEEVLGIRKPYTADELKKAYKRECQRLHPDRWANKPEDIRALMEEEQKLVNVAYDKLKKI